MGENSKTQLGKILLKRKLVSPSELNSILDEQQGESEPHERLASKVLSKGLTDEVRLLKALSEQAGIPAINLDEVEIDLSCLDIIPMEIASQHVILPISVSDDCINLAMANPDDRRVIDEVEFVSGKRVFPHVALHTQVMNIVGKCYQAREAGEEVFCGKRYIARSDKSLDSVGPSSDHLPGAAILPDANGQLAKDDLSLDIDIDLSDDDLPVPPDPEPAVTEPNRDTSKKILVVDDEDDIRLLISRVLTEKGYTVVTASRGLEAIKMVQTENPDMMILDAMLPEVHGFDICKKIKGSKKYGHIPVIMISAIYRGWRYAQDLKDSYGVDDFIEKPFKLGEFVEKVEMHLNAAGTDQENRQPENISEQAEEILAASVKAYRDGKVDEAIDLLRKGLKIDPLAFKLHYNLALILGKKALNYQAIRELESALDLEPSYFPALKNLAMLYQKAGFKFKSIETWERALHHCPDDTTRDGIKQHLMNLL
jgi:DNA-binding response OmpR family regulator